LKTFLGACFEAEGGAAAEELLAMVECIAKSLTSSPDENSTIAEAKALDSARVEALFSGLDLGKTGALDPTALHPPLLSLTNLLCTDPLHACGLKALEWIEQLRDGEATVDLASLRAFLDAAHSEGPEIGEATLAVFEGLLKHPPFAPKSRPNYGASRLNVAAKAGPAAEATDHGSDPLLTGTLLERCELLLSLDVGSRASHEARMLETLGVREKQRKREAKARLKEANLDYSKSLSATREDTKTENDVSDLLRSGVGYDKELAEDPFAETLRVITEKSLGESLGGSALYERLRGCSPWRKVEMIHGDGLPGVAWFHPLTCEESFMRPWDYEDIALERGGADPFAGLESCAMEDILEKLDLVIRGAPDDDPPVEPKTPLIVDTSEDKKMATFFRYKGVVMDLSPVGWSRKVQSDNKVSVAKVMEEARRITVVCMRHGKTLCIDLGLMGQNCMLKDVLCKETGLNRKVFEEGGKKLIAGKPTPFCKKMWKPKDLVNGQIVIDPEFRVVLLTAHPPSEVLKELEDPLPLEHVQPVVVTFG